MADKRSEGEMGKRCSWTITSPIFMALAWSPTWLCSLQSGRRYESLEISSWLHSKSFDLVDWCSLNKLLLQVGGKTATVVHVCVSCHWNKQAKHSGKKGAGRGEMFNFSVYCHDYSMNHNLSHFKSQDDVHIRGPQQKYALCASKPINVSFIWSYVWEIF